MIRHLLLSPTTFLLSMIAAVTAAVSPAAGKSLGDMAADAASDLDAVSPLLSVAFWIVGIVIVAFGLLKIKRYYDQPQQTTIASGVVAVLIGAAIIASPAVINGIAETFGITGASTVEQRTLR